MSTSRRAILGAAVAGAATVALPPLAHAAADWKLRWSPTASEDGMAGWERVLDDFADSHPAGGPHIYTEGDNWRFNMHTVDRDTMTDRQRQEVQGCRTGDKSLDWLRGETWRITYSMYLPRSLKATTGFTHVMQMKQNSGYPVAVLTLRRNKDVQTIALHCYSADSTIASTPLEPLYDQWTDVDFRIKLGNKKSGSIRFILSSGGTRIDAARSGIDTLFLNSRVFPRWGIYRSLDDTSDSLQDCHMLLTNPRAYQLV